MEFSFLYPIIVSALGAFVTWVIADSKSKSRISFIEERFLIARHDLDLLDKLSGERISTIEIRLAKSEQDRKELHRMADRLDNQKASKDVVDGFRSEITNLRLDMDKRFDRIERLFQETKQGYSHRRQNDSDDI